ncbi:thiol peroxidase [Litorilituus lipolyticus]|uniref:Thiol peroxidase n=2 Tax=Litorilituus lipolyticus TaxID=2491017 RepID=A0A502KWD0_9GAMM|nr:thiol peroxidase [Litorilituus lipolyticus]
MNFSTPMIKITVFLLFSCTMTLANAFDLSELTATSNLVKAGNKYVTLLGTQVNVGEQAPDFKVVDKNFAPVTLENFSNQTVLISVVPSLDTGVCSLQTKRFNEEVGKLPKNISLVTISNDLPFAQKRFCKTEKVDQIKVLSDSVWREFGINYGLLIKDMGLLTRAIFIINNEGKIVYKELVANISEHPNYDKALEFIKNTAPVVVIEKEVAPESTDKTS